VVSHSETRGWWIAGIVAGVLCFLDSVYSGLQGNEHIYVLAPYLMADDSLLSVDGIARNGLNSKYLFNLIGSWFTPYLDPVSFALIGRSMAHAFLLLATARLCQTMRFKPLEYAIFFVLWYYLGQLWFASEWMLSTFESKPFSYAFVILSLDFLLRGRPYLAAMCAGLGTSFHVLTGGWAQAALFASVFFARTAKQITWKWRDVFGFAVVSGIWALPGLIPALRYSSGGLSEEQVDLIFWVVGFHLDPAVWLTPGKVGAFLACWFVSGIVFVRLPDRHHRSILLGFQFAVGGLALLGYAAYLLDARRFLMYYPFRLADAFWPFLYFLASMAVVGEVSRKDKGRKGPLSTAVVLLFLLTLVGIFISRSPQKRIAKIWTDVFENGVWTRTEPAYDWLRRNTEPDEVILAPPWYKDFWIKTLRPQVFSRKGIPHNRLISEWVTRREVTLGKHSLQKGNTVVSFREKRFFRFLHVGQLESLSDSYDAKYYLTDRERKDVPFPLVFEGGDHWIYKLR
jgi:hypothetical protein